MSYKLEESLGYIVSVVGREMGHALRRAFLAENLDITPEQWGLLAMLREQDGSTQMEIACLHFKDKTNITRLIDGLERRRLVCRRQDPHDRRNNRVFLTPEGSALYEQLLPIANQTLKTIIEPLSATELSTLKELLWRVHKQLNNGNGITG